MRQHFYRQSGMVIIEVMMAIVIFSFGILGMIGLQANAIKQMGDAKLRGDAGYLAGQIISQMWVDRSNLSSYQHKTTGDCTSGLSGTESTYSAVTNWIGTTDKVGTVLGMLPNGDAQIKVETGTNLVTVTICWRAPQETTTHNFTSTALISG